MLLFTVLLSLALSTPQDIGRESYEVYLCPVHRDQQASGPGACPVCGRERVKRILVPSFSCPMHAQIDQTSEGRCPICKMTLVPMTRELQWFCPAKPEVVSSQAGACPDGSPMQMRTVPMAHGDHNPKHGGVLFMAPNGYNHLEGTLDESGTFRLYLYDDFTRPIDARGFQATIGEETLTPAEEGAFLTKKLGPPSSYPVEVELHLRFPGKDPEEARFDFVFVGEAAASASDKVALPEFRIPEKTEEIYAEILIRQARLQELIRRGAWPDLYIPALEAKDLVLALREKEGDRVALSAKTIVRAAWLLDTYGDLGNRLEVESAYGIFEKGIRQLEEAHAR